MDAAVNIENDLRQLTRSTPLLDFDHPSLQRLIEQYHWRDLDTYQRIGAVYDFVRDKIAFGYNSRDDLRASQVLAERIGQCNTKGTLLMALLRGVGIPCRLHGFTIVKTLQKGAVTGLAYHLAPKSIMHSWVEVWFDGKWVDLEGFILDRTYLSALQRKFASRKGAFCGYGAATPDLQSPLVDWRGTSTYIQKGGINYDFGVFDTPDEFYRLHGVNLTGLRGWLFRNVVRHWMNRTVRRIRSGA